MRSWKKPTPEQVNSAIALMVYQEQYRYFFDRLENPEWIEPLWKKGFFKKPPAKEIIEEEGTVRFPPWPEGQYLARMTKYKPELVAKIIQEMPDTDNITVQMNLVDAMLAMPSEVAARLVEKAKKWAESPFLLLPEKLGQLISHLAKGGNIGEAMDLSKVLLDVLPDSKRERLSPSEDTYKLPPEPRARFNVWEYEQILRKNYSKLVKIAGLPAMELLCDILEKAIQFSQIREVDRGQEDDSFIWRPSLEDNDQKVKHYTVKDVLVIGVKDTSILVIRSNKVSVEKVVAVLEKRKWKVFRRIALHILTVFSDQAMVMVTEHLTNRSIFDDIGLLREYVQLLRKCFEKLSDGKQKIILSWIEEGPDVEKFKKRKIQVTGFCPSDEEIVSYIERWQRNWLARIGIENLPTDLRERYMILVKKHGELEYPEFPFSLESGWVGPRSPKSSDEFKTMSVEEIVKFLRNWIPPENPYGEPSPEGLGRVLSSVIGDDPQRFALKAEHFRRLDPTYIRALLSGLQRALKDGKTFDWVSVFRLCKWVVAQPREIPDREVRDMEADPDWGWTRKTIADLLFEGFDECQGCIPIGYRKTVWEILLPLTDDIEPTPEYEKNYGCYTMDPATLSINTTRGGAMHAVIHYAIWVRRHLEERADTKERLAKGFKEMPEVQRVLDTHLDTIHDSSLAIRSVYGQWFPWLALIDSDWARKNAMRVFPLEEKSRIYFVAAWNAYIGFCRAYDNILELLREQYSLAVELIGTVQEEARWTADPDQRLSEHLMIYYWRGKIGLTDSLLTKFWEKASDGLKSHAIEFIGRSLKKTDDPIPEKILERLRNLWEERITKAKENSDNHKKEISAFGWWFVSGKFDPKWSISQLVEVLRLFSVIRPVYMVLDHLAKIVEEYPKESLECLGRIIEVEQGIMDIHAKIDSVQHILKIALQLENIREEAKRIIHILGSYGLIEFRELLDG